MTPDVLARLAFPLATGAYGHMDPPAEPIGISIKDDANPILCAIAKDIRAWGFVQRDGETINIGMRGTETLPEWIGNFNAFPVKWWRGPGKVHAGFVQLYAGLTPGLLKGMGNLWGVKRAIIGAHSLGCGPAIYHAIELAYFYPEMQVYLCTFASPRVGDQAFADFVRAIPNLQILRIANEHDAVTQVPLRLHGIHTLWSHVGYSYIYDVGFYLPRHAHNLETMYGAQIPNISCNTPTPWVP